jgi:hypothetical protein
VGTRRPLNITGHDPLVIARTMAKHGITLVRSYLKCADTLLTSSSSWWRAKRLSPAIT